MDDLEQLRQATRFWAEMRNNPMLRALVLGGMLDNGRRYGDEDLAQYEEAVDQFIGEQGYGLDLATLRQLRERVRDTRLAYWEDVYLLLIGDGTRGPAQLWVRRDSASCVIDGVELRGEALQERQLRMSSGDDQWHLTLTFIEEDPAPDALATTVTASGRRPGLAYCEGILRRAEDGELPVRGKRNCCFEESIALPICGDPLSAWAGAYPLMDAQTGEFIEATLSIDAAGRLQLGQEPLQVKIFSDNLLIAVCPDGNELKARLDLPVCYVALQQGRTWRNLLTRRGMRATQNPGQALLVPARPQAVMAATGTAGAGGSYPESPYVFQIPAQATAVTLPEAVEKHPYRVQLQYDDGAIAHARITAGPAPYPDNVAVDADGLLQGIFGETQHAALHKLTLEFEPAQAPGTLRSAEITIPATSRRDLTLTPETLAPLSRGASYSQVIAADGFVDAVFWRVEPWNLQDGLGLAFDPKPADDQQTLLAKHLQLKGKTSLQLGETGSFTVTAWPDPAKTIQTPTTRTYSLDVAQNSSFDTATGVFSIVAAVLAIGELALGIHAFVRSRKPSDVDRLSGEIKKLVDDNIEMSQIKSSLESMQAKLQQTGDVLDGIEQRRDLMLEQAERVNKQLKDARKEVKRAAGVIEKAVAEHVEEALAKRLDAIEQGIREAERKARDEKTKRDASGEHKDKHKDKSHA